MGNCCTKKMCCKQAISNGIVPPLLTILKSIPNPKVQCRVCRLLGNLARESNEKLCTLAKGIGIVLSSVLEDTKDVATMGMAVRATRLLWSEMPFNDEFVRADGVEKILDILIKYTIVEQKKPETQSICEQNPYERERVEFMETHIHSMENINSRAFDHEILKKSKPIDDDGFRVPNEPDQFTLVMEIMRCLEVVTSVHSNLCIIYNVRYINLDKNNRFGFVRKFEKKKRKKTGKEVCKYCRVRAYIPTWKLAPPHCDYA